LNLFSFANGSAGFIACRGGQDLEDRSRRWQIGIDWGEKFENWGIVYEHGAFSSPIFPRNEQKDAVDVANLLEYFYHPASMVSVEPLEYVEDPTLMPNTPSTPQMLIPSADATRPHTASSHPNPFGIVTQHLL